VVSDARGALLGYETRNFRVDVPVSPVVTITSPAPGEVIADASPTWPGGGSFALRGTGQAGSWLLYTYEGLSGQDGWGTDYDAPVVAADGTWVIGDGLPYGSWRATVRQYVGVGDPALGGVWNLPLSRLSAPVTVDFVLAAPTGAASPAVPVVLPVAETPTTPVASRVIAATRPTGLAYTGASETTPWAGLAGMVLVGLGAATVLITRRRASRG
jgi:LPXTG-motif cell wall-anchored protein